MKWEYINGYGKEYKVFENGIVISYKFKKEKILKQCMDSNGYLYVGLSKNNKQKYFRIHRLIAIYFMDNPNKYQCVDHINEKKTDNRIENLRWVTKSDNTRNGKNWGECLKGVYFNKKNNKFHAQISINNKKKHLGYFKNEEDAHNVYMKEYNKIMKEFNKIKI